MAYVPKSVAPLPSKRRGRSFYALSKDDRKGKGQRARKLKTPKPTADIAAMSDEALTEYSQQLLGRKVKAQRAKLFSKASPITDADIGDLAAMIGTTRRSDVLTFIEFCNHVPIGTGSLTQYGKPRAAMGKSNWLTKIHWIRAYRASIDGYNDIMDCAEEVAATYEGQSVIETLFDNLPPLPTRL